MKDPSMAPIHAFLYPLLTAEARRHGYALALHGTLGRDLDVVAIPWAEKVSTPFDLVRGLMLAVGWGPTDSENGPVRKPHGRLAFTVPLHGGQHIDLSVMPVPKETP